MFAMRLFARALLALPILSFCSISTADDHRILFESDEFTNGIASSTDSPQERGRPARESSRMFRHRIEPHWVANNSKFWYRVDLPEGRKEFVFVDAIQGTRKLAFDHRAMASALGPDSLASQLPIDSLEYDADGVLIAIQSLGKRLLWNEKSNALSESTPIAPAAPARPENANTPTPRSNARSGAESSIQFINRMTTAVEIFWLSGDGTKQSYGKIEPGATKIQHTFGGHQWEILHDKHESLGVVIANDTATEIVIDGRKFETVSRRNESEGAQRRRSGRTVDPSALSSRSPNGKWTASIDQHNVILRSTENEDRIALSSDGDENRFYGQLQWSPDSSSLIAFRTKKVDIKPVHLVRSSPDGGGRAQLETRPYALPGDEFPQYEPVIFRVDSRERIQPKVDAFEHQWLRPRLRFRSDGKCFTYEQTDRGHGRFRLIEIEHATGHVRNIIDEKSTTFVWTAHTENQSLSIINWINNQQEIVHVTERNGWRQLLLIDVTTGTQKRELTPRGIVVRGIQKIDEETRTIWFSASGRPNQDPYFVHFACVDIDSGNLVWLTEGNGTHSIEFSPDRSFLIDTYSRVDMAPVNELRRVRDGALICHLENADISELTAKGWKAPEVFVAKGRDGETDIWGIVCRPRDFDPNKKYPVIEDIYAGPQGSFVPKSFSPTPRYESLTSLGFVVVKIDGMGTANRSKAFHDVCWHNLKDGGFDDRKLWIQAAAAKYPYLDLNRVGVYGTSAGGQNAAAAVLFHPDFYKVAVAACGCHDNRMDKASWNEQWMGYPVGPHYSESSNIDNAHRLQGKLLLIVGEMDSNVPPESTLRFADALIKANKDFDLLVIPNAGHGMGGAYGQRRMHDFFVRHLLPSEQPIVNAGLRATTSLSANTNKPGTSRSTPSFQTIGSTVAISNVSKSTSSSRDPKVDVSPPPPEFFELVRERDRPAAREFYKKYLDVGGLPVVAAQVVADDALVRTREIVTRMLAGRPDILHAMKQNGMYLIIIGKDQVYTDMPEYRQHPNPEFQNERVRGTGGKPTSFGEENLLSLSLDRYDDESIGVHEFCHTIDGALRSIDPGWSNRLRDTFQSARQRKLYERAYAASNAGEYWAEICQSYFDCNRVNNWNHGPVGTREQLKSYDPLGYELVRSTFQLTPEQDWRYSFMRTQPSIETPPTRLNIDPYYTKFTWAREFTIVGREASDAAMLRANDVVRKMFAYRHDLLKSFIASGTKLVILGRKERLSDLPEVRSRKNQHGIDLLSRYLEYSVDVPLLVVGEESLDADPHQPGNGEYRLIQVLANAVHRISGMRDVDPNWENRPRNLWQQYELRLKKIDSQFDQRLQSLFEKANQNGKWQGTRVHDASSLWTTGVLAYFDASGQTATPIDSPRAIETREQLSTYDPELYDIVNETMSYDHHVDWRLPILLGR